MTVTVWGIGRPDYSRLTERVATSSLRTEQFNLTLESADTINPYSSSTLFISGANVATTLAPVVSGPVRYLIRQIDFSVAESILINLVLYSSKSSSTILDAWGYQNITINLPSGKSFNTDEDAIFTMTNQSTIIADYATSVHGTIERVM